MPLVWRLERVVLEGMEAGQAGGRAALRVPATAHTMRKPPKVAHSQPGHGRTRPVGGMQQCVDHYREPCGQARGASAGSGKQDLEIRALPGLGVQGELRAVAAGHAFDDGEAEPAAGLVVLASGEEGLEDALLQFTGDPGPCVLNTQQGAARSGRGGEQNDAARFGKRGDGVAGIGGEIECELVQLD